MISYENAVHKRHRQNSINGTNIFRKSIQYPSRSILVEKSHCSSSQTNEHIIMQSHRSFGTSYVEEKGSTKRSKY